MVCNVLVYTKYPISAPGLNHNETILLTEECGPNKKRKKKRQTVDVNACILWELQGFICENYTITPQDICLDTEKHICHFDR